MNLQQTIYRSLQEHYGDATEVFVEDLMHVGCGHRHVLRLTGRAPSKKEEPQKILLRESGLEARKTICRYLRGCFKNQFQDGYFHMEGSITARIDGFLATKQEDGSLGTAMVEIDLVSTIFYDERKPPSRSVLQAITKAALVGADKVLLIVVDRDKQDWSFWTLTGDFSAASETVRHDINYVNMLARGEAIPIGMASERTCRRCPYFGVCTLEPTEDPPPYSAGGIKRAPAGDIKISMESYLWGLNSAPNHRATKVIHPSEISTTECDRVIAYGLMGVEERPSIDPKLRRIFDFGHVFHDIIQSALSWAIPDFEAEVPVKHRDLKIKGHCDGRVTATRGIEIKSIGSRGFERLTSAKSDHKKQATVYGVLLDMEDMDYVYANKETGDLGVYQTPISRDLWHKIATRARRIVTAVGNKELPEGIDKEYTCAGCKYAWKCKPHLLRGGLADKEARHLRRFSR